MNFYFRFTTKYKPIIMTISEVRLYHAVGADALGMSTCHEVVVAKQCLMKVSYFEIA